MAIACIVGIFVFLNSETESTEIIEQETREVRPFVFVQTTWEPHAYLDKSGEYDEIYDSYIE